MKRIIFIITLVLITMTVFGQTNTNKTNLLKTLKLASDENYDKVSVYLSIGYPAINWLSNFKDEIGSDYSIQTKYLTVEPGINVAYALSKNIKIESGIYYMWNTGKGYHFYESPVTTDGSIDLDYLILPLMLKAEYLTDGYGAGVRAGLKYGINTRAETYTKTEITGGETYTNTYDFSQDAENIVFLSFGLNTRKGNFGGGVDFDFGLNNIMTNSEMKLGQIKLYWSIYL